MLANERVMTIAASSPAGETSVTSASAASGLPPRHVTAIVGCPAARIRSTTVTASEVEPDREMITTGSRPAPAGAAARQARPAGGGSAPRAAPRSRAAASPLEPTAAATWAR